MAVAGLMCKKPVRTELTRSSNKALIKPELTHHMGYASHPGRTIRNNCCGPIVK